MQKNNLMKYLYILLTFFLFSTCSYGQSLEFTHLETYMWGDANAFMTGRAFIKNSSSDTVGVKVRRNQVDIVSGTNNYFCWDVCYPPSTSISPNALSIAPNDTVENFYADYESNGNTGLSKIQYCFYNESDINDSICVFMYFYSSPTGVETLMYSDANTVSSAYPNPAAGTTKINYTLRNDISAAKIDLHNMLGAKVKSIDLKEKFAAVEIPLSGLESGVYFYSLIVDEKAVATKKLVVTK